MICETCKKPYSPSCDYNQGRCPHHEPLIKGKFPWEVVIVVLLFVIVFLIS